MIEGGKTPVLSRQELAALGFHLILYPLSGLFAAARALETTYRSVAQQGTTGAADEQRMSFAEFNELIGVEIKYTLAERFGAD
jgi:2-methylisocitrate lyase-like PEP mutase family enzyme